MEKIRVVFMGTPEFSENVLNKLIELTNVVLVVTKKDAYVGRKKVLTPSYIKNVAIKNNIDVLTPSNLKEEYQDILDYKPDLIVTCAYGKILPKVILDYPKYGCINVHASILPKYRGASPILYSIMNGDDKTGVTLMYMDEGMDTGDIIDILETSINEDDDFEKVHDKLSILGGEIIENNINKIMSGTNNRYKQDNDKATYTKLITSDMEEINFNDYGKNIINKIRAFSPYPLVKYKINDDDIKIIKAHFNKEDNSKPNNIIIGKDYIKIGCIDGYIYLDKIKKVSKGIMDIKSYINGLK